MYAIMVVGKANYLDKDEQRFTVIAEWVAGVLKDYFFREGVCSGYIMIDGSSGEEVAEKLQEVILENPEQDLCMFYIGHGDKNGWAITGTKENILEYEAIRLILAHHYGCLIFVNDCCFGLAGQKALESHSSETLFIAASPEDYLSNTFIIAHLLKCWLHGQVYNPVAYVAKAMIPSKDCIELYDNFKHRPAVDGDGSFISLRIGQELDYLMFRRAVT